MRTAVIVFMVVLLCLDQSETSSDRLEIYERDAAQNETSGTATLISTDKLEIFSFNHESKEKRDRKLLWLIQEYHGKTIKEKICS